MKILDLFCGRGGWSIPFIEDGDEVIGIDIVNHGYPKGGQLILQDIRTLDGARLGDFDLIIGSPPCTEFSQAKEIWKNRGHPRDVEKGLELIHEFRRVVKEASPRLWAFENVANLLKWYNEKPIWRFKISKGGRRCLWGNIPLGLSLDYVSSINMAWIGINQKYGSRPFKEWASLRAIIPYPIARFIADSARQALLGDTPN